MNKQELHDLVNTYWKKRQDFSSFYLHREIDAGESLMSDSVYEDFLEFVNEIKIKN